ncbi:MAG TPA: nitrite/sulfite reductase, partial [Geobacteraceae bacterium]|nr:nitrite/sulfite reductase [Geobacteraceae bacterium]
EAGGRLVVPVFAGQLTSSRLRELAMFADRHSAGVLQVTADQDIAYALSAEADADRAARELKTLTEPCPATGTPVTFRVCPGNHECTMGMAATREIAAALIAEMSPAARESIWAISGCPNSCSQPQLASLGIVVSKLVALEDGSRSPRFDLYRRSDAGLGGKVREQLTLEELSEFVKTA